MSHEKAGAHRHARSLDRRRLLAAIVLTAIVMLVEIAGGAAANSLSLLSDAGHMFTDLLALSLALFAATMASRPPGRRASWGYYRIEILAALANGVLLIGIAGGLLLAAWRRLADPPEVAGPIVTAVAAIGLAANVAGLLLLRGASGGLNVRGAAMHVLSDALSSAVVVAGGLLITYTGWGSVDPILGIALALVIVYGAFRLVREAVDVLLEATPASVDLAAVEAAMRSVPGVSQVHDLHVWSITSGMTALSGHVILQATTLDHSDQILNGLKIVLRERFRIEHSTIQIESCDYREVGEVHEKAH